MAVQFPEPIHPVDPVEMEINQLFDHLIVCLNQRRVALLTTYRDTRAQIAVRPIARARKEQELIGLKTETEDRLQMNELRETQLEILEKLEQKLAEVRIPQPETRAVFRGNCGHLEQVIAGVGEIVEEEIPIEIPMETNYSTKDVRKFKIKAQNNEYQAFLNKYTFVWIEETNGELYLVVNIAELYNLLRGQELIMFYKICEHLIVNFNSENDMRQEIIKYQKRASKEKIKNKWTSYAKK